MSGWDFSVVVIVPAQFQDKANRLACALGYDELPGNTFSVPLSSDGSEPVTHFGCRTAAKQEFIDIMTDANGGDLPDIPWVDFGTTEADIAEVIAGQIFDVRVAASPAPHFGEVLAENGLMRVWVE